MPFNHFYVRFQRGEMVGQRNWP